MHNCSTAEGKLTHTCIYGCPHWTSRSGFLESKRMPIFGISFELWRKGCFPGEKLFLFSLPLLSFLHSLHHLLYQLLTSGLFPSSFSVSVHVPSSRPSPALLSCPLLCIYFASCSPLPFPPFCAGARLSSPLSLTVSLPAAGNTKSTGEAISSSHSWSLSREKPLKDKQSQVKVTLRCKIVCTEYVQPADRDHPIVGSTTLCNKLSVSALNSTLIIRSSK